MRKEKSRSETLRTRFIQGLAQVLRSQLAFEEPYSNKEFCQKTLNHVQSTLSFMTAHTGFPQMLLGFRAQQSAPRCAQASFLTPASICLRSSSGDALPNSSQYCIHLSYCEHHSAS